MTDTFFEEVDAFSSYEIRVISSKVVPTIFFHNIFDIEFWCVLRPFVNCKDIFWIMWVDA